MTMPDLWMLGSSSTVDLLGWTLLHVVWQGALLAALLAGALYLLRHHTPRVRYAVSCAALVGLLALPVGTSLFLSGAEPTPTADPAVSALMNTDRAAIPSPAESVAATPASPSWPDQATAWLQPVLPWLVWGWGIGVILFALRFAGGAWRVRRLRTRSTRAPSEWRGRLQALADRMDLRQSVALRQSERVEGPVVAGWWRPVVLVPTGLLSGLPPAQVEALLLHELAHVRRHDILVGRLQAVVETLLFFHPATWWISRQVRQTREACCDDCAVRAGTDRTVYARALAAMAERAVAGSTAAWAPAASDGSLLTRIRRLLSPPEESSPHTQRLSMAAAVLLLVGVPLGLAACASQQSATDADSSQTTTVERNSDGHDEPAPPVKAENPITDTDERNIIVLRDDSTERAIRIESSGPVRVDSLDGGAYVLRYDGRVDTLALPDLPDLSHLDDLEREFAVDADSLERVLRARVNADSIRRVVRMRIDRDSLEEEVVEMRLRADSLARWHREHADSLRRHLDSLRQRMVRERPKRLREQARRLREQAERLERRAEEMEAPAPPEPAAPDSVDGG